MNPIFNTKSSLLFIASFLLVLGIVFDKSPIFSFSPTTITSHFQKTLNAKEAALNLVLDSLVNTISEYDKIHPSSEKIYFELVRPYQNLDEKKGFSFFILKADSILFWTTNKIPLYGHIGSAKMDSENLTSTKTKLLKMPNGWYLDLERNIGDYSIHGLILIKTAFNHQNIFLRNEFQEDFQLPHEVDLSFNLHHTSYPIYTNDSTFFCSLTNLPNHQNSSLKSFLIICCYVGGLLLLLIWLKKEFFFRKKFKNPAFPVLFFLGFILLLRLFFLQIKYPPSIFDLSLFQPALYATSALFPSLGDFAINSFLLLFILLFLSKHIGISTWRNLKIKIPSFFLSLILLVIPILFSRWIDSLYSGLIENSKIEMDFSRLLYLSWYSLLGIVSLGALVGALVIIGGKLCSFLKLNGVKTMPFYLSLFTLAGIEFIIFQYWETADAFIFLWPYFILIVLFQNKTTEKSKFSVSSLLLLILITAFFSSYYSITLSSEKNQKNATLLGNKLSREKDPIAEFLFNEVEQKLIEDKKLPFLLLDYWKNKNETDKYILETFFEGFWNKYDLQFTVCNEQDSLYINATKVFTPCFPFFESVLEDVGESTSNPNFLFLNNISGRISYLGRIKIPITHTYLNQTYTLFIELDSKFNSNGSGYPELLLDERNFRESNEKSIYSYAKYKNNELLSKSGSYIYSKRLSEFLPIEGETSFKTINNFNHTLIKIGDDTLMVISFEQKSLFQKITIFSILFALFSLLIILVATMQIFPFGLSSMWVDLKNRIPIILISTLVLSILIFGIGTIQSIRKQNKENNYKLIGEKTHSVLIELEHKLGNLYDFEEANQDYLNFLLAKFANVFFTDINLYTREGALLATSRNEIFENGLIDKRINPTAFFELAIKEKTEFIQSENIGKLSYISSYIPIRSATGKNIAYLNLPYFAKQSELEKEISGFLAALINFYVLIFVLFIFVALLISRYITYPLHLLKNKLKDVRLGTLNETIDWKGKDEIGGLINEYNRMVMELSVSATKLAQSERESAWREMAKQVAHEIKNPLTPIKLSVQHIEKAWKDKAPDFNLRLAKFTASLTEQIDTLTRIANEFSHFAKMPQAKNKKENLIEIIENSIHLYKDAENVSIDFMNHISLDNFQAFLFADRDQVLRVFNNLIKNAIQAVPSDLKAQITLQIKVKNNNYIIEIKDNGSGIPLDVQPKIFTPSFTTKNTGMGLGLAIVKNIINNLNGDIWFETSSGAGTSFFFTLPIFHEEGAL